MATPKIHFASPCEIQKPLRTSNSHLKLYLKASKPCFHVTHPIPHCKTLHHLARVHRFSLYWTPRDQPFKEAICTSHSISDMARIRGGHTDPSSSHEPRPRASSPQDSTSQAPEASTVPSSEGGVPSNPPQRRYETWRPSTSPPPEPLVRHTPTKRARTSGPGESSRHAQPDTQASTDS